jgi:hypothetical protein
MMNFASYFYRGVKNTLRLKNGFNLSYKGPWVPVYSNTVIDEWYVGDFMAAEYTVVVDYGNNDKEIIKCLVVAGPETANVVTYGRTNLGRNLIEISATVTASKVSLVANPAVDQGSTIAIGSKLIFSANYYYTLNELGA